VPFRLHMIAGFGQVQWLEPDQGSVLTGL